MRQITLSLLLLTSGAWAQNAAFTTYGIGCDKPISSPCLSVHWGRTFAGTTGGVYNYAVLANTESSARKISGVELFVPAPCGVAASAVMCDKPEAAIPPDWTIPASSATLCFSRSTEPSFILEVTPP